MKLEKVTKRCVICGEESEQEELISFSNFGTSDFDLKPDDKMMGVEIQECPHCHYCNYDISQPQEERYKNPENNKLKMWQQDKEIQDIIKNEVGAARRYLIMAEQFSNKMDFESTYHMLIKLSWLYNDEEKANQYRMAAATTYINYILPETRTKIMQMADILRMSKEFEVAGELNKAAEALLNEAENNYEFLKKVVEKEKQFIASQDSSRHNLSEIE